MTISTHVLDTERGRPAVGIEVELWRGETLVAAAKTDAEGRVRQLAETSAGTYRLVFRPGSPFFRTIAYELELDDGHHHVPLLLSSYGCASYRGS